MKSLRLGYVFKAPEPQTGGYVLTRDLFPGDTYETDLFVPYGGQPWPVDEMRMPLWLFSELEDLYYTEDNT